MMLALYIFLIFIGLLLAQEVFRRFPKFALAVFLILPIILTPSWIENGTRDWFLCAKAFSISIFAILFLILKIRNIRENKFAKVLIYLFLVFNMLEAVARDAMSGGTIHYLNAIAGILLIVTIRNIDSISVTQDKLKDVIWEKMTLMWIIGYTLWNWVFVYLNLVHFSALHIAFLGAPLAIAFFDKGRWLQTRVITLGIFTIVLSSLPHRFYPYFFSSSWKNEIAGYYLAEASFVFMILYLIFFLQSSWSKLDKKNYRIL